MTRRPLGACEWTTSARVLEESTGCETLYPGVRNDRICECRAWGLWMDTCTCAMLNILAQVICARGLGMSTGLAARSKYTLTRLEAARHLRPSMPRRSSPSP